MNFLKLSFYNLNFLVKAPSSKQNSDELESLSEDFNYFISNFNNNTYTELTINNSPNFYEQMRDYIFSTVGEQLEKQGWMRLHALGLKKNEKNLIFCLNSKGGKSSMAMEHLLYSNEKIFSDEIVFTNGYKIRAFPISIALSQKAADDLNLSTTYMRYFKKQKYQAKYLTPILSKRVADEASLDMVYVINSNILIFIWSSFWGLGLPQIARHLIRWNNIVGLFKIAFIRIQVLYRLFSHRKIKFIKLTQTPLKINALWKEIGIKNNTSSNPQSIKEMNQWM